jgi:hypothetical protein
MLKTKHRVYRGTTQPSSRGRWGMSEWKRSRLLTPKAVKPGMHLQITEICATATHTEYRPDVLTPSCLRGFNTVVFNETVTSVSYDTHFLSYMNLMFIVFKDVEKCHDLTFRV